MKAVRILSAEHRPPKEQLCLRPYQQLPFSLASPPRPLLKVSTKAGMRKQASRQVEDHFQVRHWRYCSKENRHSKQFKIRARKKEESILGENEGFWMDRWQRRGQQLRVMHEGYLSEVGAELQRRKEWSETETEWNQEQKLVQEYNIIYSYKESSVGSAFP